MVGGASTRAADGEAGHGLALWEALQQPGLVPAAAVQALVQELSAGRADLARFREEPLRPVSYGEWLDILGTYRRKLGDHAVDEVLLAHLAVLQQGQCANEEPGYPAADGLCTAAGSGRVAAQAICRGPAGSALATTGCSNDLLTAELRALRQQCAAQSLMLRNLQEEVKAINRDSQLTFSVCQYNILARYLGQNTQPWLLYGIDIDDDLRARIQKKFYEKGPDGKYANAGWPKYVVGLLTEEQQKRVEEVQATVFDWEVRRKRLLGEIARCDADVLSLVELDEHTDFKAALRGYDSVFEKRPRPSSKDGCAIFWRRRKFRYEDHLAFHYVDKVDSSGKEVKDRAGLIARLSFVRDPQQRLIVISTHLARNPEDNTMTLIRAKQVAQLMRHLTAFAAAQSAEDVPVVLMGDLNAMVFGEIRGIAKIIAQLSGQDLHPFFWRSQDVQTGPTSITSVRDVRIDAVMFDPHQLQVRDVDVPLLKEIIPNEEHPSDHVPVMVRFQLTPQHERRRRAAAVWLGAVTGKIRKVPMLTDFDLEDAFKVFDRDYSGRIDDHALEDAIMHLGSDLTFDMQRMLLACFGGTVIQKAGFMDAFRIQLTQSRMPGAGDIQRAFQVLDKTDRGVLTLDELRCIFHEVSPVHYSDSEVDGFLASVKTDADGYVDLHLLTATIMGIRSGDDDDSEEDEDEEEVGEPEGGQRPSQASEREALARWKALRKALARFRDMVARQGAPATFGSEAVSARASSDGAGRRLAHGSAGEITKTMTDTRRAL